MPRTNCNIIKDLLPSYQDELCSIESKQLIEEHFGECSSCKKLYEQLSHEVSSTKYSKQNADKELDYLKIIRINVNKKNTTLLIITSILFLLQIYINFNPYRFGSSDLVSYVNYLFPLLIAGTLFCVLPDFTEHPVPNKNKLPILGVEFAAMTIFFTFITLVGYKLQNNILPLGLQPEEIGPFLIVQILVLAVCFILLFVVTLILSLRKKAICPALCFLPLVGLSLMFEYQHLLHELSSRFSLTMFIRPYVIFVLEFIALVGVYMLVNRKKSIY